MGGGCQISWPSWRRCSDGEDSSGCRGLSRNWVGGCRGAARCRLAGGVHFDVRLRRVDCGGCARCGQRGAAFAEAERRLGGLDCVVVSAGINVPPAPLANFDDANFWALVETNIVGAYNALKAAAQKVQDGGTIIVLTTSLVRHAVPGVGPYAATKAAVETMVRSLARELAGRGVRVNCVAPGPVDTDLFRSGKDEAAIARSAAMSPFNRVGRPEEIGNVIAFLASDKASWISGQIIQPNGGLV
ncbi:SDR family oxidoreductase [Chelativorans composti]|uniref:SDR family oxidoreductase n=1 Tax=Chelativorans composti TaxID=768533 RepID=A0ABW5DJJ5_9HYPH